MYNIDIIDIFQGVLFLLSIPVKNLKENMVVSQSIYNKSGGAYLVKGRPLTGQYITRLKNLGIPSVSVTSTNPKFQLRPPEDIVREDTRVNAIQHVCTVFENLSQTGELDTEALQDVSDHIILDVIQRHANLVQLTDIRLHDTYTFAHSVNVAVLSAVLGFLCHYKEKELSILTLGGLLHDIGKIKISTKILNKRSRLDNEEFSIMKSHTLEGAHRIHEMCIMLPSPSLLAAIAAQHHERIDGKGYPRQIAGSQIHRFAKIVAIADVYDALTSERPYKKAYTPSIAHNIMKKTGQGQFDEELLTLFFNNVAIYLVGTVLKTFYGYGIVTKCEFGHTETPIICLFADKKKKPLPNPVHINLKDDGPDAIEQEISGMDLMYFTHDLNIDPSIYLTENQSS